MAIVTFFSWLKRQRRRRDLIGTLARDYCAEPVCCPRDPEFLDDIFMHIEYEHGAGIAGSDAAVRQAWREYRAALWQGTPYAN